MIDWVKASIPLNWTLPISGGQFLRISPDGELERTTILSKHVRGSFDEHCTLRTIQRGRVEVDFNPSKFLQGHNLVGSNDLCGLLAAGLEKAMWLATGTGPHQWHDDYRDWLAGHWELQRVDLAEMYELPNRADCRAWLRAAGELARMKWRGRGMMEGTTLYFGKAKKKERGKNWSLKGYVKADELELAKKGHGLHDDLPLRAELLAWADNKVRFEVSLRAAELKRYSDGRFLEAFRWNGSTGSAIFQHYFSKMELGTNAMLPAETYEGLKPAVRLAYNSWKQGTDLLGVLPRKTFYRYRKQLLDATAGEVDLKVPQLKSNVVPLVRVLELKPAPAPTWLEARPDLFFRRAA